MASVLSFKNVSKEYKRGKESVAVLDHFNLEIAEKDFVAIMGPSGSGKTTLLNLIGGLDRPSAGEITVAGERLDHLSGSDLSTWRARQYGKTIIMVTHDPKAASYASRQLHVDKGQLLDESGLLPALRAARVPVTTALRAS